MSIPPRAAWMWSLPLVWGAAACGGGDDSVCGDGVVEGSEQCDPPGPGCTDSCQLGDGGAVDSGPADAGPPPAECGNGEVERGEHCEPPGTDNCNDDCRLIPEIEPDPACDMTGHWMAQKVTVSEVIGVQATTYNHFYYDIVQDGETATIVDSLHCGFYVETPLLQATLSEQTATALRRINDSDGRTATYVADGDECRAEFDDAYVLRGLEPQEHWLDDEWAGEELASGEPSLPEPEKPNCECDRETCECDDTGRYDPETDTPGWEDWDEDGLPGVTIRPGGGKVGLAQRDWDRYLGTTPQASAGSPLEELELDVEWNNTQTVLFKVEGTVFGEDEVTRDPDLHYVTFRRMEAPDRNATSDAELCQDILTAFAE